jgi:hypothetical protein
MFTVRQKLYDMLRASPVKVGPEAVGQTITISDDVPPGGFCRAEFRGTTWRAVNIDDVT